MNTSKITPKLEAKLLEPIWLRSAYSYEDTQLSTCYEVLGRRAYSYGDSPLSESAGILTEARWLISLEVLIKNILLRWATKPQPTKALGLVWDAVSPALRGSSLTENKGKNTG